MAKDKKYNVLYLDDEESNLRIFRAAFKHHYKIFTAKSGLEGIEVLKQEEIHLIITDQRMPKMTGVEFLENIIPNYPDPIRIIITGFADIEDIVRALNKCGIHRYIVKPWNREELKLTIDKALETYQLKKDNSGLVQELKEINNSLEGKIQERTSELMETNRLLQDAKEKAEEASYAKERFLSTMSHEKIHLKQQLELLILPFYIIYILNYLFNLIIYKSHFSAYYHIVFEREAYANEMNHNYLQTRPCSYGISLFEFITTF